MNRRRFLLSALAAPAVVTTAGLLMPVRAIKPSWWPLPYDGPIDIVPSPAMAGLKVGDYVTCNDVWFMSSAGLWRVTYVAGAAEFVAI